MADRSKYGDSQEKETNELIESNQINRTERKLNKNAPEIPQTIGEPEVQ